MRDLISLMFFRSTLELRDEAGGGRGALGDVWGAYNPLSLSTLPCLLCLLCLLCLQPNPPSPSLSTFLCSALFCSAAVRGVPGSPLCLVRCEPITHNVSITNPPVETWPPHCRGPACKLCRGSHPPDHLIAIVTSERSLWALHGFCI